MTGSVRVLHIAETAHGGVGTYLNQVLPALVADRDTAGAPLDIRVLLPAQDSFMLPRVDDAAITTWRRDGRSLWSLLMLAKASWHAYRTVRPEIVHLHSTFAGMIVRPLLLLARVLPGRRPQVVYSPHGWAFQIAGSRWRRRAIIWLERTLARITDRVIVLSDAEMRECVALGFPPRRLQRIYNGISAAPPPALPAPEGWPDQRLKVLFIGRFDHQKGLDTLIAAARLAPDRIAVRCIGASVVSGGPALDLPDNVAPLGWLDEPRIMAQLAMADVVAMPSRWEGFGLVAIEAMRAGLPVVASRIGGLPEVVEEGVTGRLVPPDDPEALLAALLADTPETRRTMAEAGRARFLAHFTARDSARQVATLYRQLLGREAARS